MKENCRRIKAVHPDILSLAPFLKWAGGKRQLLPEILARVPQKFEKYYEPFLGGGAVLFAIAPSDAVVGDVNHALINTYQEIKEEPEAVIQAVEKYDSALRVSAEEQRKAIFLQARAKFNELGKERKAETAGLMLFLNKHCFNGLFRVNRQGAFNVPYNKSIRASYQKENILSVSQYLQKIDIRCTDFEELCLSARTGDFVFLDSPYAPLKEDSFVGYTKDGFSREEHIRLAKMFQELDRRCVFCMATNHNTKFVRELYQGFSIDVISARRTINRDARHRTEEEVIIRNYA